MLCNVTFEFETVIPVTVWNNDSIISLFISGHISHVNICVIVSAHITADTIYNMRTCILFAQEAYTGCRSKYLT
jgi:hypothetical protein